MSWEEAVDRIRRGFANPDVEQVTDTADAVTFGFFFVRPYEEAAWATFYRDVTTAPAEPDEAY